MNEVDKLDLEKRVQKLEKERKKDKAYLSYLEGFIKGLFRKFS